MISNLTPEQEELRLCVAELDALEREINARNTPKPSSTKVIPFKVGESFVFKDNDMRGQRKSYVNGAEDLYVTRINFASTLIDVAGNPTPLGDSESGLVLASSVVVFDFFWNYKIGSQGENYGSTANDVLYLSRKSLANKDRVKPLTFEYPLRLKAGDAITFLIKPALYNCFHNPPGPPDTINIVVTPILYCRRDGRMAEDNYGPEFRAGYRTDRK